MDDMLKMVKLLNSRYQTEFGNAGKAGFSKSGAIWGIRKIMARHKGDRPSASQPGSSRQVAFLRQVQPFATLDEEALTRVAADFQQVTYKRDEVIFRQADQSREIYVIAKGKVRIYKVSPSGGETSINIFFPTDIVGEFAAIDDKPRSAAAKAIGSCALLRLSQEKLLAYMRAFPDLAIGMARLLTSKIRWTAAYAETVAQYDAAGRLLHTLLLYNAQYGQVQEPNKRYLLDLDLNQADLASLIGARREWVNRLLQDWRRRGLIEYERGKITILDLPRVIQERDSRIEAKVRKW